MTHRHDRALRALMPAPSHRTDRVMQVDPDTTFRVLHLKIERQTAGKDDSHLVLNVAN